MYGRAMFLSFMVGLERPRSCSWFRANWTALSEKKLHHCIHGTWEEVTYESGGKHVFFFVKNLKTVDISDFDQFSVLMVVATFMFLKSSFFDLSINVALSSESNSCNGRTRVYRLQTEYRCNKIWVMAIFTCIIMGRKLSYYPKGANIFVKQLRILGLSAPRFPSLDRLTDIPVVIIYVETILPGIRCWFLHCTLWCAQGLNGNTSCQPWEMKGSTLGSFS